MSWWKILFLNIKKYDYWYCMYLLKKLKQKLISILTIDARLYKIQEALGRVEARQTAELTSGNLQSNEFRVSSQWGEDGIIQKLIRHIDIKKEIFIEFGVERYTESNTRFLLTNNNWSGLVIDGNQNNIDYIKKDQIYWQHNLKAECSFITKENINQIFDKNGIQGDIGILSIDIDGDDYWVWEAITTVNPAIVIVEYNAKLGADLAVTVPYESDFIRLKKHYSMIYYGASLKALHILGNKKGYTLVGCNSTGANAFFVRQDLMVDEIKEVTVEEGYVCNSFRESRDINGNLTYLSHEEELKLLLTMPLIKISP